MTRFSPFIVRHSAEKRGGFDSFQVLYHCMIAVSHQCVCVPRSPTTYVVSRVFESVVMRTMIFARFSTVKWKIPRLQKRGYALGPLDELLGQC